MPEGGVGNGGKTIAGKGSLRNPKKDDGPNLSRTIKKLCPNKEYRGKRGQMCW